MTAELPDAIVGAGTVTQRLPTSMPPIKAGARFLVSPGTPATLAAAFRRSDRAGHSRLRDRDGGA